MNLVRFALSLVLGAAVLVPAPAAGQPAGPESGSSGIGDPYWPLDGNGGIDVASYRIHNSYDFRTRTLKGRTVIRLKALTELSDFSLDFLLPVKRVSVDRVRADHARSRHELRITPRQPLAAGSSHVVVVKYAGRPGRHGYAGEKNWLANRREVITMNEPHMAPWWFPANDHPTDKALVSMAITVPKGKQVIANGKLRGKRTRAGRTTWRWKADEPMATYLAFFAAGDFRVEKGRHHGLPWVAAVSRHLSTWLQRRGMRLMRASAPVARGLEKDLGPYPFSTTGGVVTSLDPGFALENQTRPTYSSWVDHSTVVHEIAHQWFGDDVAVARWRDIWLNEGFASFMEWRWTETHGGARADRQLRWNYDAFGAEHPFWDLTIGDPGPARVFDHAVYVRGAMTMQALRNRVGDPTFWRILRTWIQRKSGGNGTSEEFEALASELSGQDLGGFFTAWLRSSDQPADTAANGLG